MTFKPWTFFLVAVAGWMNRQQQDAISYLRVENQVLREKLGQKRIILNDNQKRRLAAAAMKLGRDVLRQFGTLFSPDTILRWNRMLIAYGPKNRSVPAGHVYGADSGRDEWSAMMYRRLSRCHSRLIGACCA